MNRNEKPIIQLKFANKDVDEIDIKPFNPMITTMKALGYYPIVTGKDVDISTLDVTKTIAYVGGSPITVKDVITAKILKSESFEDEIETNIRIDAADNIKQVAEFISSLNGKIQMLFPDNSEVYSIVKLADGWMETAAISGGISSNIYSNNPFFKTLLNDVQNAIGKDDDLLTALDNALDARIAAARSDEPDMRIVSKTGIPNNLADTIPQEKAVSIEEIAEERNLPSREELKQAAKELVQEKKEATSE